MDENRVFGDVPVVVDEKLPPGTFLICQGDNALTYCLGSWAMVKITNDKLDTTGIQPEPPRGAYQLGDPGRNEAKQQRIRMLNELLDAGRVRIARAAPQSHAYADQVAALGYAFGWDPGFVARHVEPPPPPCIACGRSLVRSSVFLGWECPEIHDCGKQWRDGEWSEARAVRAVQPPTDAEIVAAMEASVKCVRWSCDAARSGNAWTFDGVTVRGVEIEVGACRAAWSRVLAAKVVAPPPPPDHPWGIPARTSEPTRKSHPRYRAGEPGGRTGPKVYGPIDLADED